MTEHEDIKAWLKKNTEETHARIDKDVQKLKDSIGDRTLPPMVKCYIDILILDIDLLKTQQLNANDHIDRLDELLDSHIALTK